MTDEEKSALQNLDLAWKALQRSNGGKTASGLEKAYSEAYQVCVRLGLKPQIRKKYR